MNTKYIDQRKCFTCCLPQYCSTERCRWIRRLVRCSVCGNISAFNFCRNIINARSSKGIYSNQNRSLNGKKPLLDQLIIVWFVQLTFENIHLNVSFDIHWIKMPENKPNIFVNKFYLIKHTCSITLAPPITAASRIPAV